MKPFRSFLVRLIGCGLLLAVLPLLARWSERLTRANLDRLVNHADVFLALFWIVAVVAGLTLLRLAAQIAADLDNAGPFLREVATNGLLSTFWSVYRRRTMGASRLIVLFGVWAVVIFFLVLIAASAGTLDGSELYPARVGMMSTSQDTSSVVRVFLLSTADNNPVEYLRNLADIVRHFRSAGVKVIVAEDPGDIATENHRLKQEFDATRDSLRRSRDVVLCERLPRWFEPNLRYLERTPRAVIRPDQPTITTTLRPDFWTEPSVPRWAPCLFVQPRSYVDAGLLVAGRYLGVPDTTPVICVPGAVRYGSVEVPVPSSGWSPVLTSVRVDGIFLDVSAVREIGSDTLWFFTNNRRHYTYERSPQFPVSAASEIAGKVVFVDWFVGEERGIPAVRYAGLLQEIFTGRVVKVHERAPLWIAAPVILLSAFLCARLRLRYAVPLLVLFGAALYGGGVWLLVQRQIMLGLAYPAVAAILSAVIFPLVRLAHEYPSGDLAGYESGHARG